MISEYSYATSNKIFIPIQDDVYADYQTFIGNKDQTGLGASGSTTLDWSVPTQVRNNGRVRIRDAPGEGRVQGGAGHTREQGRNQARRAGDPAGPPPRPPVRGDALGARQVRVPVARR